MDAPNLQIVPHEMGITTSVNAEMSTLYGKMARVMGKIAPVEKTGTNEFYKYKFQTAEAIANAVRNILAAEGVAFFASMVSVHQEERQDSKGKTTTLTQATFDFTFACSETGATITHRWFAESLNNSDKGINQVATAATKYFLMKTFLISTPDEADADANSHERGEQPQLDQKQLYAETRCMFDDDKAYNTLFDTLWKSKTIQDDTPLTIAMAQMLINQASTKYEYTVANVITAINTTLPEDEQVNTFNEYIKAGHTHAEAWEAISAHAELADDKPAKPKNGAKSLTEIAKANAAKSSKKKTDIDILAVPEDDAETGTDPKDDAPNPPAA